jgi:peptidoglycan/LPS O-acetylase OafA/YrhL
MPRNNFLDCIRAIAALLVLAVHANLLPGGGIGVSMFFCLSGYLIATILLQIKSPLPPNLCKFVFRRFMRIWPLMAVQIVLTAVLLAVVTPDNLIAVEIPDQLSDYLNSIPALLTFTNSTNATFILSRSVLWTLQAEFWFYVLMATVLYVGGRRAVLWLAIAGLALPWLTKLNVVQLPGSLPMRYTFVYFDQLMIGVVCAFAIENDGRWARALFSSRVACLWTPLVAIAALSTLKFIGFDLTWYLASSAAAYLTAVTIIHQSVCPLKGDYEPLATLGRISYSMYLMHAIVFEFVSWRIFPYRLQCLFEIGLTILVSMATYRWIELPFVHWSKQKAPLTGVQVIVPGTVLAKAHR